MRIVTVKCISLMVLFLAGTAAVAQDKKPEPTLKGILVAQLKSTHTSQEWFVTTKTALEGVTVEQAKWKDEKGNHSIGQLAYHLWYWNSRNLQTFKGEKPAQFSGNNEETFDNYDAKTWKDTVGKLDQVMTEMEKVVEGMDEATLKKFADQIAHVGAHNSYHLGQIVVLRRQQGSWDPSKGVK
jgi:uncharacterized damage-inducible protein DinB